MTIPVTEANPKIHANMFIKSRETFSLFF